MPAVERPAVLSIRGLVVRYGSFVAVDGIDLDMYPGEVFGLLGPNGAGKTTTIGVLIGRRTPTAGTVTLAGHDVARDWQRVKPLFGYVPDRENHFDEFTGRRNLSLFADLYGVPHARIAEVLAAVELTDAADVPVKAYSLGMRRKLLLARAVLHKPRVLYLDEPTANLDIHSVEIVHRILRGLTAEGVCVVLTTHNMKEVEEVCDRVAILSQGKLVALDSPTGLKQAHADRKADVTLKDGSRLVIDMDDAAARNALAIHVARDEVATLRTREFDFHEAFLKLTGTKFD